MAIELKKPDKTKGILIFTHKEVLKVRSRIDVAFLKQELLRDYYIGVHLGGYIEQPVMLPSYIDFVLGLKDTVNVLGDIFHIPMCSKNFTEDIFKPYPLRNTISSKDIQKRKIDFLCVSNLIGIKKIHYFLDTVNVLSQLGRKYNFTLIAAGGEEAYVNKIQDKIDIARNLPNIDMKLYIDGFNKFSRQEMASLYRNSKFTMLLSRAEGANKSLAEGLLSGSLPFVFHELRGGGLQDLNDTNSYKFKDYNLIKDIDNAMQGLNDNKFEIDIKREQSLYRSRDTIPKLMSYIDQLYKHYNEKFDFELSDTENLNFKLPGHDKNVPWYIQGTTSDITTIEAWEIFFNTLSI